MDYIVFSARVLTRQEQYQAVAQFMIQMDTEKFMAQPSFEHIKFEFKVNTVLVKGNQVHFANRDNMNLVPPRIIV